MKNNMLDKLDQVLLSKEKKTVVSTRIPDSVFHELRTCADLHNTTVSMLICFILCEVFCNTDK